MALEQKDRDYEILVRYNDDGKVGFHRQTLSEIIKDGVVLASTINPPEKLSLEDLKTLVAELSESDIYVPPALEQEAS